MGALRALTLAIPIVLASLLSHGCGVSFRDSFDGTEVFKGISISGVGGDCVNRGGDWQCAGVSQLTVHMTVTDGYPVPVQVACYMENPDTVTDDQEKLAFHERAPMVAEATLQPAAGAKPGDKHLQKQPLDMTFAAPPPGKYFVACVTPAAPDNGLGVNFTVS
ncbi:MAG TPA: hypothetical protein VH951_07935 [Dehalococcoidia bacterium]